MTATTKARINFVELPARDLKAAKAFYAAVFGWALTDFGPSYACTMTADVDLGAPGRHDRGAFPRLCPSSSSMIWRARKPPSSRRAAVS